MRLCACAKITHLQYIDQYTEPYSTYNVGVGAGPACPVLAGPLFRQFI